MNKGAKAVSDAILGMDFRTVVVAGKAYTVTPPTIHRLAGAVRHLSGMKDAHTVREVILSLGDMERLSRALSWLVRGDESLSEELAEGTVGEVADAIESAADMIGIKDFRKAVSSAKSVSLLAARPK